MKETSAGAVTVLAPLGVRRGDDVESTVDDSTPVPSAVDQVVALVKASGASRVYLDAAVGWDEVQEELALVQALRHLKVTVQRVEDGLLVETKDLPFSIKDLPDNFSAFRRLLEGKKQGHRQLPIRAPLAPPRLSSVPAETLAAAATVGFVPVPACSTLPDLEYASPSPLDDCSWPSVEYGQTFVGGERAAIARLDAWLAADSPATYKETRNGMLGLTYSTKLSPWLSSGGISPRLVYRRLRRWEDAEPSSRMNNVNSYWVVFELLVRDYFRHVTLNAGRSLFGIHGIHGQPRPQLQLPPWRSPTDPNVAALVTSWRTGTTGVPIVDACMRELAATGFMSNRGRQIVASFLVRDLRVDWRVGAEWFEALLVDHDVAANWANWAYAAGVGNDPRGARYFHPIKQSKQYDPQGDHRSAWLPELGHLAASDSVAPWKVPAGRLRTAGVILGKTYPRPVVDMSHLDGNAGRNKGRKGKPWKK
jgi:deoxyribodipyrimidine photo-lyase